MEKISPSNRIGKELKVEILQIRNAAIYEVEKELAPKFIQKYKRGYPSLIASFSEDLEALLSHLKLPVRHRKSARTTNLIKKSFLEEKRRTRAIPGFWTGESSLKLLFSVFIKAC